MQKINMINNQLKHAGFTLIELVMVVVLIGVLSAVAIPRYASLTTQAKQSSANGMAGGLSAAVAIVHAQWIASGSSITAPLTIEGSTVYVSPTGWPEDSAAAGTGTATAAKCLAVWNAILNSPPAAAVGTCTAPCQYLVSVTASPICKFTDQQGAGTNVITYNISTGAVVAP